MTFKCCHVPYFTRTHMCWRCVNLTSSFYCPIHRKQWLPRKQTRNSAIADKPARRVYKSVKDTKHSTSPCVRYSFLLCNSRIVALSLRHRFYDIRLQKCRDLENRVRGPSRSLEMSPCDTVHTNTTLYSNYGSISCRFWNTQCRKMSRPWNRGQRSLKVIESGIIR